MQVYTDYENGCEGTQIADVSSVLRIQNLQVALQKAIGDISLLQQNLAYVIQIKEELEAELAVRDQRQQAITQECQKQLIKKSRQLESARLREEELIELLQDTKQSLENKEIQCRQREDEAKKMTRIIENQKNTIHSLEEELLPIRYEADLSSQNLTLNNMRVQELEHQCDNLQEQLQKMKSKWEKSTAKSQKLEKELQKFKTWLGGTVGVRKVVDGCERVLMEEISNRLNCAKQ